MPPIEVVFSIAGGFYPEAVQLELTAPEGATIYYTTDGSAPIRKVRKYTAPINVRTSMSIRAVAFLNQQRGLESGQTYFIKEHQSTLPTVALSVNPNKLFHPRKGWFMEGENVQDSTIYKRGANFWGKGETSIYCQIFETDGRSVHAGKMGMRLFGGFSRIFPQKSLALIARESYGDTRIRYPVLGKKGKKKFKYLVLRNAGSDFGKAHLRDALMGDLTRKWNIERQDYRAAQVYINGEYWGIYNMREKVNRHFIAQHHDVNKDSIDLMEHRLVTRRGTKVHYEEMLQFIEEHSLASPQYFAQVESMMEVDNFMDYQIAQIYCDNRDAGGNIKYWRPQEAGGRWRWILYDADWGLGLHDAQAYTKNSLAFHTEDAGPKWPNPPWSTFILRNLLENEAFQRRFVNRFLDYLNTDLHPTVAIQRLDKMLAAVEQDMPRHLRRWQLSTRKYRYQTGIIRQFLEKRPQYIRQFLQEKFQTGEAVRVQLNATPGGKIRLNDNVKIRGAFTGQYFKNIPIQVEAVADYGYRFSHWEGLQIQGNWQELTLPLDQEAIQLKAVFEPYQHPLINQLVINEISPNNKKSSDWLELFNNSEHRLPLKDWVIADKKHKFRLPNVTIAPNDYLVICEDSTKFMQVFPNSYNVVSGLDFGISKLDEELKIYAADGAMVDSMSYKLEPQDTTFTLSLLLPSYDNALVANWSKRSGIGTPNAPNPYYIASNIRLEQQRWLQVGMLGSIVLFGGLILVLYYRFRRTE
ncbi:MAG: CotH kinase family protein [Bacteroidota bacterium]